MKKNKILIRIRHIFNLRAIIFIIAAVIIAAGAGIFYKNYKTEKEYFTYTKANELFEKGYKQSGIKILEHILKRSPNNSQAAESLAIFYYSNRQYDDFAQTVKKYNLSSNIIENLLASLASSQGDETEAIRVFESLIRVSNNPNYFINYSTYYLTRGNLEKAAEVALTGAQNNPASPKMNAFAASVCLKKADKICAQKFAQAALAQDEGNAQAKAVLENL